MMVSRTGEECKINVEGKEVVMISRNGECDEEVEQRKGAAARVARVMRKEVLDRRELQTKTKMRVSNAVVIPILLYGCKTWTLQRRNENKLQAFDMMCLRV